MDSAQPAVALIEAEKHDNRLGAYSIDDRTCGRSPKVEPFIHTNCGIVEPDAQALRLTPLNSWVHSVW